MKWNRALTVLALAALGLLASRARAAEPAHVTIKVADKTIEFRAGKDLVTTYHKGPEVSKPYFWPVRGPGGVPLTRGWPMEKAKEGESTDHPHQKSAWFCHGDVIPEGLEIKQKIGGIKGVDFWSEARGHGKIVCTRVGRPRVDGSHGQVTTVNEWRTADGTKVLDEKRTIHLYDFGDTRLLVLEIDLHASAFPITFGDTKEGSMGVRINDTIRTEKTVTYKEGGKIRRKQVKGPGRLENAQGKVGEKNCWGRLSKWCDYSGTIGGKTVGLAILDDPANKYPAYWHSRGYGLMAANPFGRARSEFPDAKGKTDLARLAKGEHLKLRYGVLLHPGDARGGKVAEFYQRFVKLGKR
jgi:hypothetical protein